MNIMTIIGMLLTSLGALFLLLGAIGIVRMPDMYTRMQAGTKATTLGAMSFILGIGFMEPAWLIKTILIVVFIALSNPISSHALARAAHRSGIFPLSRENIDLYKKDNQEDKS